MGRGGGRAWVWWGCSGVVVGQWVAEQCRVAEAELAVGEAGRGGAGGQGLRGRQGWWAGLEQSSG